MIGNKWEKPLQGAISPLPAAPVEKGNTSVFVLHLSRCTGYVEFWAEHDLLHWNRGHLLGRCTDIVD
jgi:hypothetical protein